MKQKKAIQWNKVKSKINLFKINQNLKIVKITYKITIKRNYSRINSSRSKLKGQVSFKDLSMKREDGCKKFNTFRKKELLSTHPTLMLMLNVTLKILIHWWPIKVCFKKNTTSSFKRPNVTLNGRQTTSCFNSHIVSY